MKNSLSILLFGLLLLTAACADRPADEATAEDDALEATAAPRTATAVLTPTQGNQAGGTVTFTAAEGGVRVQAAASSLSEGRHGFHIHENGDCSAPDGTSAGGHYNPTGAPHGAPDAPADQRHAGDLGNLEAGADGTASYDRIDPVIALDGPNSIVGRAVIIHGGADDLTSQPTGAAGARLACGVIQLQESGQ